MLCGKIVMHMPRASGRGAFCIRLEGGLAGLYKCTVLFVYPCVKPPESVVIPVALSAVLQRPDVWRGDHLARCGEAGLASGFAALDAELPGGGWPRGALSELLAERAGIGELSLLAPALGRAAARAPVALVAPPAGAHAPGWARMLPLARLLQVQAQGLEAAWAAEQLLASSALGALLLWLPERLDVRCLRRLQLAAEGSEAAVFVFRPAGCVRTASPAPLRVGLQAHPAGLQLRLLKRRGAPAPQPLLLDVERPVPAARLAPRQPAHAPAGALALV